MNSMLKFLPVFALLVVLLVMPEIFRAPVATGCLYQIEKQQDDDGGSLTIYRFNNNALTGKLLIAGGSASRNKFAKFSQAKLGLLFTVVIVSNGKPCIKSLTVTEALNVIDSTRNNYLQPDSFVYQGQKFPALKPIE